MAFTFAGQFTEAILATGSSGATLLPALTAHVYTVNTTTHVTLYTSRTKGTTTGNPVTTDVNGNLTFFVDPGQYDVVFTPPGGSQKRVTISVPQDPSEDPGTYPSFSPSGRSRLVGKGALPLRSFHAALANVAARSCNIVALGDSLAEGSLASTEATRWLVRLRDQLRARFQPSYVPGGEGYVPPYYFGGQWTARCVIGGTGGTQTAFGLGMRSLTLDGGTTNTGTFTFFGTSVDLYYTQSSTTGGFQIWIDGVQVATNGAGVGAIASGQVWNSGALTRGTHTIMVKPTSATGVYVEGIHVYDGDETSGVHVWDSGRSGAVVNDFNTVNSFWNESLAAINSLAGPDLVLIEVGRNDWSTNVPLATFKTNMTTLIGTIRATCPNTSIAFVVAQKTDSGTATGLWTDYVQAYYDLADADGNIAVIDLYDHFGASPLKTAAPVALIQNSDGIHLTDAGALAQADIIAAEITPAAPSRTRPVFPRQVALDVTTVPAASSHWNAPVQNNLFWYTVACESDGTQNASIEWDVALAAGTYSVYLFHRRFTDRGQYRIFVDGTQVSTLEGYNASADSARDFQTAVTVTGDGPHRVKLVMATKNASSTSYIGSISRLIFERTA